MTEVIWLGAGSVAGILAGVFGSAFFVKMNNKKQVINAEKEAERIVSRAKKEAHKATKDIERKAKQDSDKIRSKAEGDIKNRRKELDKMEQSLKDKDCLLYTSPSPRDRIRSRMPSSA